MKLTIDYGKFDVKIGVTPYGIAHADDIGEAEAEYGPREFWSEFMEAGRKYQAPPRNPGGEDFRIIKSLLNKYGVDKLRSWLLVYWSQDSSPLYEGYPHVMRHFASCIPTIRSRLMDT